MTNSKRPITTSKRLLPPRPFAQLLPALMLLMLMLWWHSRRQGRGYGHIGEELLMQELWPRISRELAHEQRIWIGIAMLVLQK